MFRLVISSGNVLGNTQLDIPLLVEFQRIGSEAECPVDIFELLSPSNTVIPRLLHFRRYLRGGNPFTFTREIYEQSTPRKSSSYYIFSHPSTYPVRCSAGDHREIRSHDNIVSLILCLGIVELGVPYGRQEVYHFFRTRVSEKMGEFRRKYGIWGVADDFPLFVGIRFLIVQRHILTNGLFRLAFGREGNVTDRIDELLRDVHRSRLTGAGSPDENDVEVWIYVEVVERQANPTTDYR